MAHDHDHGRSASRRALLGALLLTGTYTVVEMLGGLLTGSLALLADAGHMLSDKLGSVATRGEGTQNLLCAYLAAAVLVGLLGNALFGLWWLDPVAALVVAGVAVREGRESWRGEDCC